MEICQSCLTSFEDDATRSVQFTIWEEVNRQWYLCPDCSAKLRNMVLGFMGEQGPADTESDELVNEIFEYLKGALTVDGKCSISDEQLRAHAEGVVSNQWRPSSEEPETTVGPAPGTVYQTTINGHKANVLIVGYPESEVDKIC